jgi:hypothetical protein
MPTTAATWLCDFEMLVVGKSPEVT